MLCRHFCEVFSSVTCRSIVFESHPGMLSKDEFIPCFCFTFVLKLDCNWEKPDRGLLPVPPMDQQVHSILCSLSQASNCRVTWVSAFCLKVIY